MPKFGPHRRARNSQLVGHAIHSKTQTIKGPYMPDFRFLPCVILLSLCALPGCRRGEKARAFDPSLPITLSPAPAQIPMNGRLEFTALRSGQPDPTATWEVLEPEGGVILQKGVYLAPAQPGTFTVVARDPQKPSNEARIQVQVQLVSAIPGSSKHSEIFDPKTMAWVPIGTMREGRAGHTATVLLDGKVLITGGYPKPGDFSSSSAEIFDPATGSFRPCRGGMHAQRDGHAAILLKDGRVLILGGIDRHGPFEALEGYAEAYDPKDDQFHLLWKCPEGNQLALLEDGRVLIAGRGLTLLDPSTGQSMTTTVDKLGTFVDTCLVPWRNGKVLILGGAEPIDESTRSPFQMGIVLDTQTLEVNPRGRIVVPRWGHIAWQHGDEIWLVGGKTKQRFNPPLTDGGQALGYGPQSLTPTVDIFDSVQWDFRPGPKLNQALPLAPGVFIESGLWFQAGGRDYGQGTPQTYLLELPSGQSRQGPPMSMARRNHTVTFLKDGRVLVVGGLSQEAPPVFPGASDAFNQPFGAKP